VRHRTAPDEQGSVALALLVILVATTLVVTLLVVTEAGLRGSRRAGDSANALQLADAGINDGAKAITANASSFSRGPVSLGNAGSYTYTATKDGAVWHLDSTGTDPTGVKRRVLADAVDQPIFGNAFFAASGATIKGTADSYTGPTDRCSIDPGTGFGSGVVGSNGTINFTGGGNTNCHGVYPADGCTFYGQASIPTGTGCPPPPASTTTGQKFIPPPVTVPAGLTSEGTLSCPNNGTIPSGTHLYTDIILRDGCKVTGAQAATLYATSTVTVGTDSGSCKSVVNAPVTGSCTSFPNGWYQTGWPSTLRINVAGNGSVSFANHAIFWGVIDAPNSPVSAAGGGTPQVDVFGSVVGASAAASAQFAFHFDRSLLQQFSTGEYLITNWREEPVP
jgi:hypothetical protein